MSRTYGSEYHLFRNRREHPEQLDAAICAAIGIPPGSLDWLYPKNLASPGPEPEGLGFIPEVRDTWREFWPTRGSQQCWDGVARVTDRGRHSESSAKAARRSLGVGGPPCQTDKETTAGRPAFAHDQVRRLRISASAVAAP